MSTITDLVNIAALRANSGASPPDVFYVDGYYSGADGGGGMFFHNAADTSSSDNGGTIIVDASNNRWYREYSGPVSAKWFGAYGTAVAITDAVFTAGSSSVTSNSASWTAADVGKVFLLADSGTSGSLLVTTIASFVNANSITLTVSPLSTSQGTQNAAYGWDDTAAFRNIVTYLNTLNGGDLYVPAGTYLVTDATFTEPFNIAEAPIKITGAGWHETQTVAYPPQFLGGTTFIVGNRSYSPWFYGTPVSGAINTTQNGSIARDFMVFQVQPAGFIAYPLSGMTGNITNGSTAIMSVVFNSFATTIFVNMPINGAGIPVGTYVTAFSISNGTITLSQAATATATGVTLSATTGNTTSGSATISSVSFSIYESGTQPAIFVGMPINGSGIPAAAYVVSFTSSTITLNVAATATATGVTLSAYVCTGTINGTTTVTGVSSTNGLNPGMAISGTDIPAGTTIAATTSTTITLSQAATGSGSVALTPSWTPIAYASVFGLVGTEGGNIFENIFLSPVYSIAYQKSSGRTEWTDIKGQALYFGFNFIDLADITRINRIHLWPYWSSAHPGILAYQQANAVAFIDNGGGYVWGDQVFAHGYQTGLQVIPDTSGNEYAGGYRWGSAWFEVVEYGLWFAGNSGIDIVFDQLTCGHTTDFGNSIAGSQSILINSNNNEIFIDFFNSSGAASGAVTIESGNAGNIAIINSMRLDRWNFNATGTGAIGAAPAIYVPGVAGGDTPNTVNVNAIWVSPFTAPAPIYQTGTNDIVTGNFPGSQLPLLPTGSTAGSIVVVEGSNSNFLLNSQDVTKTGWAFTNLTIGTGITDPWGGVTAQFLDETTTNGTHTIQQTFSVPASSTIEISAIVQATSTRAQCYLAYHDLAGVAHGAYFTLVGIGQGNIQFGSFKAANAGYYPLANGWYQIWIQGPVGTGGSTPYVQLALCQFPPNNAINSYAGTPGDGINFAGAMVRTIANIGEQPATLLKTGAAALTTPNGCVNPSVIPLPQTAMVHDTNATGHTLTAASMTGSGGGIGVIWRTGPTANFTDSTDTAANIIAALPSAVIPGGYFECSVINNTAFTQTIAPGSGAAFGGVTSSGNFLLGANARLTLRGQITSSTAVTIYA